MKTTLTLAFLLLAVSAFGQSSGQMRTVTSKASLIARVPVAGERVAMTTAEGGVRFFTSTSTLPSGGTNLAHVFASGSTNQWWVSDDKESPAQNVRWFGAVGDGSTDDYAAFNAALNYTNRVGLPTLLVPAGDYAIGTPIAVTHNYPLRIEAINGGFDTGWISTNFISEARLIYTGTPTTYFVDLKPTAGFRCGCNIVGITFDANGLADVALNVQMQTRGTLDQVRLRNAPQIGLRVANTYYLTFLNPSISSNERVFTFSPAVGIAVTNEANNNVFIGPVVSGTTNWAMWVAGSSVQNQVHGGAFESNDGGGLLVSGAARLNGFYGLRFEANDNTNRHAQVDSGVYGTVFVNAVCENLIGKFYIDGSYTRISESHLGSLEFGPNAGNNEIRNVILANGEVPTGYTYFQNIQNAIDLSATLRTNTVQNVQTFYGEKLQLWNGTDAYPRVILNRAGIYFGDGSGGPSVGWTRFSDQSLATSNGIVMFGSGLNAGLLSAYSRTNDSEPRIRLNVDGTFSWGFGLTNPVDFSFTHVNTNELRIDGAIVSLRTNVNLNGFAVGMTNDANLRAALMAGGRLELGDGVAARSVKLEYTSAGTATIQTNLIVPGELTLGGVARTSWPTGSGTNASTVYVDGTQVDSPNFVISTEIDPSVASGTNVSLALRNDSITTNKVDSAFRALLGGGGGDVTLAGNNTFTGTNVFGGETTISNLTVPGTMTVGSVSFSTPLGLANGGTGAGTAAGARTNLGLVIGYDVQAYDANLAQLATVSWSSGDVPYFDGSNLTNLATTAAGRTLLAAASAAAQWDELKSDALQSGAYNAGTWDGVTGKGVTPDQIVDIVNGLPGGSNSILSVEAPLHLTNGVLSLDTDGLGGGSGYTYLVTNVNGVFQSRTAGTNWVVMSTTVSSNYAPSAAGLFLEGGYGLVVSNNSGTSANMTMRIKANGTIVFQDAASGLGSGSIRSMTEDFRLVRASDTTASLISVGAWVSASAGIGVGDFGGSSPLGNSKTVTNITWNWATNNTLEISVDCDTSTSTNDALGMSVAHAYLRAEGASGGGTGDVVGPASSTDSVVALFDGTTGKLLKDGTLTEAAISAHLTEAEASALYQGTNSVLTTLATLNGSALTNLNASSIASGTLSSNRLPADIALTTLTAGTLTATSVSGDGSGLTNLNGSNIASGTVAAARIDTAIARTNGPTLHSPVLLTPTGEAGGLTVAAAAGATNATQLVTLAQLQAAARGGVVSHFDVTTPATGFTLTGTVGSTNRNSLTAPATVSTNTGTSLTTGDYVAAFITTNVYSSVASGLAAIEFYAFESAAGSPQISAEVYVVNSVTKSEELEFTPGPVFQTVVAGTTPTLMTFSVPITDYSSTTNFHIAVKLKQKNSGTVRLVTGGAYDGHISFSLPSQSLVLKSGDTMTGDLAVPDEAYGAGWDSSVEVPTKNAVYDQVQLLEPLNANKYQATNGNLTTLATLNASALTNLNASNLASGTVSSNRLPAAIALTTIDAGTITATSVTGDGSGLTNLNGSNIASGTVAAARIDSAIARTNAPTLHSPTLLTPSLGVASATSLTTGPLLVTSDFVQSSASIDSSLGAAVVLDFKWPVSTFVATNNVIVLQSTNRPSAATNVVFSMLRITGDTVDRTISYPAAWKRLGTNITTIPSNKVVLVSGMCIGTDESGVTFGVAKEE